MKKLIVSIGLIILTAAIGLAQKSKQDPTLAGSSESRSTQKAGSSAVLASGVTLNGELQNTVDVKKSKVGDEVILKTTNAIKENGQTVIPKGTRLIGRITDVQERTRSNTTSKLGVVFDRLEGKDLSAPITASIVSITNVAASGAIGDTAGADVFASSNSSARTSAGTSSGGGLLGGVTNTVGGVTGTAGNVLGSTVQTAGSVANTAGQTLGNTVGSTASAVGRTVNGIQISNSASGSVSSGTTLSSSSKNVRLEKGATLGLQVNSAARSQ